MSSIEDDAIYTPSEAAELMKTGYRTLINEVRIGRLHAIRVGPKPIYRFPGWALRDYAEGRPPRMNSLVASMGATSH